MSQPAIEVSGLGKRYVIEHEARHDNLRDTLHHTARKLWRRLRWGTGFETEEFWALRDIGFSVQPGEVIGIVGRNGAGKSTLLKVLSRITEPTTGSVRLRGRVASLLEVGTGFHPDLTGRENIFLNGAILGMSRAEIRRKFDEIVAFAEVERFLDTPVKRYSSGMYVRLAFAVAAHLEPEILIVDEVLAVGDVQFQKKCLGKMRAVAQQDGRTVLFVSHNLGAIQSLCQQAVLLEAGRLVAQGTALEIVDRYNRTHRPGSTVQGTGRAAGNAGLVVEEFLVPRGLRSGEAADFSITLRAAESFVAHDVCLLLHSSLGVRVAIFDLRRAAGPYRAAAGEALTLQGRLHSLPLVEGEYQVGLYLNTSRFQGDIPDLETITVSASAEPREVPAYPAHDRGFLELKGTFTSNAGSRS